MARPRLKPAVRWRVRVREAEVANPLGSLPMTRDAPFGAHTNPEQFAGSVVRVQRAGGPPLLGIVERTAKNGCAVWVTLMAAGNKLRSRRYLGCEVVHVLSEVDRGPEGRVPDPNARKPGPAAWSLTKLRLLFAHAKKVVEYRYERRGDTTSSMADGPVVLAEWIRRRKGSPPHGRLSYLGASRYRLQYDRTWWVDFESDPP